MAYKLAVHNGSDDPRRYDLEAKTLDAAKAEVEAQGWGTTPGAVLVIEEDGYPGGWLGVSKMIDRPMVGQVEGWLDAPISG